MAHINAADLYDTSMVKLALDSKQNIADVKRQDTYSGITDANGLLTITFSSPFASIPRLSVALIGATFNHLGKVNSVSKTGCTIQVGMRNSITLLGLDLIASAVVNAVGVTVNIIATEP